MKCSSASGDTQIPWQKSGSETVLNSTEQFGHTSAKLPAGYAEPLTRHTRSMSTRSFFTWAPDRALPIAVSLDFDFAKLDQKPIFLSIHLESLPPVWTPWKVERGGCHPKSGACLRNIWPVL